jgi:hypothetical protein
MTTLVGTEPNQIPTNGDLGDLAYQDAANIAGPVGVGGALTVGSGITAAGASVVSANSTDAALRITQLGTGNALLVEDSTNPDSTPFVIDANGDVLIGGAASTGVRGSIVSKSTQAFGPQFELQNTTNDSNSSLFIQKKDRLGAIVQNNDAVGGLWMYGYDGASYIRVATIVAAVDGTPGTNDMPGRLAFSTTADGASSPTERLRITSAGNVGIGTTSPTQPLDVNGNVAITGNARRITGDFSNATVANRVAFQTSTVNGQTGVIAIPNGTSTNVQFEANSDSSGGTNASVAQMAITATDARFSSGFRGTGTYLPMTFYTGGSERVRITTSGDLINNGVFYYNARTITASVTLLATSNAMSLGPLVINDGVVVTVPDGGSWSVL